MKYLIFTMLFIPSITFASDYRIIQNQDISGEEIGVLVEGNETVIIANSVIHDNEKGIYVKDGGRLVIFDSIVENNDEEGIDIRENVVALIQDNSIRNNGESGIETESDGVNVEIRNNIIKHNKTQGVTVQFRSGIGGKVNIQGNTITENAKNNLRCNNPANKMEVPKGYYKEVITINKINKVKDCNL